MKMTNAKYVSNVGEYTYMCIICDTEYQSTDREEAEYMAEGCCSIGDDMTEKKVMELAIWLHHSLNDCHTEVCLDDKTYIIFGDLTLGEQVAWYRFAKRVIEKLEKNKFGGMEDDNSKGGGMNGADRVYKTVR